MTKRQRRGASAPRASRRAIADRMESERARIYVESTENLARAMEAAGVSQTELARRIGVHKVTVTQFMRGTRLFTLERLADAFTALGFSLRIGFDLPAGAALIVDVDELRGKRRTPVAAKRARRRRSR